MAQTIATLCTCLSFLFLGASTGFALNVVCIIRNFVFYFQESNTKINRISTAVLALVMVLLGVLSWQGPISLLVILALGANTVFLSFGKPQLLRKSVLVTSSMVLTYNVFVFSIGGIANEAVSIVSSAIGILRIKEKKKTNATQAGDVPDTNYERVSK